MIVEIHRRMGSEATLTLLACWYPYPISLFSHTHTSFAIAVTVVSISSRVNFHGSNKYLVSAVNEIVLKTYHTTHDVVDVEHQIVIALYNVQALP